MKLKILPPGVQYGEETDLSPQVAGIGGDDLQGFGSGLKKKAIDDSFVLVGDGGNLFRQGEHHMKVRNIEKLRLPVLNPLRSGQTLAFGTVAIAAAIIRVAFVAALVAAFQVTTQNRCATHFDGGHGAPLLRRQGRAMLLTISFPVAAEYIRHFPAGPCHGSDQLWDGDGVGRGSRSSGLTAAQTAGVDIFR